MVRRKFPLALLLGWLLAVPFLLASAQPAPEVGTPVVQAHTFKEFNDVGQIWTILQDHRGVMFFGITGGDILEYDGVTWRKIFTPLGVIRSLAQDESGRIWVGGGANFGYLAPDDAGSLHFVSLLDKVPAKDHEFTDVWQVLLTPQGVFFRSYDLLFRWDGKAIHSWATQTRFQALSAVNDHIYTAQNGIGLQEIVGDELRNLPGGDGYKDAQKLLLYPYGDGRMLVTQREGPVTLYDGQTVTPFPNGAESYLKQHRTYVSTLLKDGALCVTTLDGGVVILEHDGRLRQILDTADGLPDSDDLSAYQDRSGALWLGTEKGVTRVETGSPLSIFSRDFSLAAIRYQGSVYVAQSSGSASVERLISDPKTHRPSFVPIPGASQSFSLKIFKDPTGKTPNQLLVATSDGVMTIRGDKLTAAMPDHTGPTEQAYSLLVSRKTPNRVFIGHGGGLSSMRWEGGSGSTRAPLPGTVYASRSLAGRRRR